MRGSPILGGVACGVVAWTLAFPAAAGEITLGYPAMERLLVTQVMTQGGRLYLEGDPSSRCRYAFIQEPRVSALGERLRIRVLFSGRAGVEVAGRCAGPGDTLDLDIQGVPSYVDGRLFLDQLTVEAPDSVYFKGVSGLVTRLLRERLSYSLREDLATLASWLSSAGAARFTLGEPRVRQLVVGPEALVFDLDLETRID